MLTHVAIRFQGDLWYMSAPKRHHHIIQRIVEETGVESVDVDMNDDQGFLDESGNYYGRVEALVHALACGQVKDPLKVRAGILTSEDVW
jgi:hypothetical protein